MTVSPHAELDTRAQGVADLFDNLPWCECTGFIVVEEEEGEDPDPSLNRFLQAFDLLVFDGYVTDFLRIVRAVRDALPAQFTDGTLETDITVSHDAGEDPNQVPLSFMVHYNGIDDEGYTRARAMLMGALEQVLNAAVEEWTRDEGDDEEMVETLV